MILPKRKHARYRWHDYNGGLYFVTICTKDKRHLFGHITDNQIVYTEIGRVTASHINQINAHWHSVKIIASVVMPNHVHMIIDIDGKALQDSRNDSAATPRRGPTFGGLHSYLAVIIGGVKAGVKRYANQHEIMFEWQSSFHDHIIRDEDNFEKISDYIANNIINWNNDCYNS